MVVNINNTNNSKEDLEQLLKNKGDFQICWNVLMTTNKILTKNEKIYKSIFIA